MRIDFHPVRTAFICASIVVLLPALTFAQRRNELQYTTGNEQKHAAPRALARDVYNESLKRLFADLEQAQTSEQMRAARSLAVQGFKKALEHDASYSLPYYNLGVLAEADGDRVAAIKYFEQFRRLTDKKDLALKAQQKLSYLTSSRNLESTPAGRRKEEYEQTLTKVNALINLGLMKEAVSVAARASELDPSRWESYALIATALLNQRLFTDALGFFQQANVRAPVEMRPALSKAIKICEENIKR